MDSGKIFLLIFSRRRLASSRFRLPCRSVSSENASASASAPSTPQGPATTPPSGSSSSSTSTSSSGAAANSDSTVPKTRPPSIDAYLGPKPNATFLGKYGGALTFGIFLSAGILLWFRVQFQDIAGRSTRDRDHAFASLQRTAGFFVPSMRLPGEENLTFTEGIKRAVGRTPDVVRDVEHKRKEAINAERAKKRERANLPTTAAQLHYAAQKSIELERDEQRARGAEYRAQLHRQVAEMQAKRKSDNAAAAATHE